MKTMINKAIEKQLRNMKNVSLLAAAALSLAMVSCHDYDHEIADLEDRLEMVESVTIPGINQQIVNINNSITELQNVDVQLNNYIKTVEAKADDLQKQLNATNEALRQTNADLAAARAELNGKIDDTAKALRNELASTKSEIETKLAVVNEELAALRLKDKELDGKIEQLKAYVENDLKKYIDDADAENKTWATATFSTLEQYKQTQEEISAIKALIQKVNDDMTALEQRVNTKIDTDVNNALAALRAELAALKTELQGEYTSKIDAIDGKLTQSVKDITDAYSAAVATAKTEITSAYTSAIETAVTASEAGMKNWVDSTLADGYYKKAEIEAELAVLDSLVNTKNDTLQNALNATKDELQAKIDAQQQALEKAQAELTEAYKQAIETAIATNNGIIEGKIADAANAVRADMNTQFTLVNGKITEINDQIENIWKEISAIKEKIETIEGQIANINSSITDLQNMDQELKGYISALQTTAADLQKQLDDTNAKIDNVKKELGDEIDALEQNLLNKLEETKKALEDNISDINDAIKNLEAKDAELEGKITDLKSYVENDLKKYIDDADAANKVAVEDWAKVTFATIGQYDALQLEVSAIKNDIVNINNNIAEVKAALEKKIADDIKAAIDALRTELNADYVKKIEDAVAAVTTAYTQAINDAKADIEAAYTTAIANAIAISEAGMKDWVNDVLASDYYKISEIDALLAAMKADIEKQIADNLKAIAENKQAIEDNKQAIEDNKQGVEDNKQGIEDNKQGIEDNKQALIEHKQKANEELEKINAELAKLSQQIADQKTALETAKAELTTAYEKAISDAITANNGVIDTKIASAVEAAKKDLQDQIDAINKKIDEINKVIDDIQKKLDDLQSQIDELVKNFADRIQSVSFVPQYSDGKVKIDYTTKTTELDFLISPANLAETLKQAWSKDNNVVTAFVRYTSDPGTRAAGDVVQLNVTAVAADASGMITVSVAENNAAPLSTEFWKGDVEAVVYIKISDGNSNVISDMIPMVGHSYVSSSKGINGFGEGQTESGEVIE